MTARLFEINDVDQALPTLTPNYVTRALISYGTYAAFVHGVFDVHNGFGFAGGFGWGAHDEVDGVHGEMAMANSILGSIDTGGSSSEDVGAWFYGLISGNAATMQGRLRVLDFGCGSVVLDASNNAGSYLGLLSIAGRTLSSQVGSFTLTSAGPKVITGLGFRPELVLIGGVNHNFWGNPNANVQPGGLLFGAAAGNGEFCVSAANQYLTGTTSSRICRTSAGRCLVGLRPTTALASMDSFDADGFTLDVASADGNVYWFHAFADPGGEFAVGVGTQGDASVAPGFDPDAILFPSVGNTALDATQQGCMFAMGGADSALHQYGGVGGGSAANRAAHYWNTNAIVLSKATGGVAVPPELDALAVVTSMGATTSLNWTLDDGSGVKFGWVALKTSTGPGFAGCGLNGQIYRWLKR